MDVRRRLREMIDARGLKSQAEAAALMDIPPETLNRILTGTTLEPGVFTLAKITHGLGETVGALLEEKGFAFDGGEQKKIRDFITWLLTKLEAARPPLIDAAARPNAIELDIISDRNPSASPDAAAIPGLLKRDGAKRVFRARGDSMNPAGILHDDLLFVKPAGIPRMGAGKIVVCIANNRTYVKKLDMRQRRIRLLSADERYGPIEIVRADISFVGIVLGRMGAPAA